MRGFLVGLGTGAVLGILLAPRSGNETREKLRTQANDLMDSANEQTARIRKAASKIQEQVSNLGQQKTGSEEG